MERVLYTVFIMAKTQKKLFKWPGVFENGEKTMDHDGHVVTTHEIYEAS